MKEILFDLTYVKKLNDKILLDKLSNKAIIKKNNIIQKKMIK
jgi:hypothetical protein